MHPRGQNTHNHIKQEPSLTVVEVLSDASPESLHQKEEMMMAIERIYSPTLKSMKLLGLYFGETSLKRMSAGSSVRRRGSFSFLYCCVVAFALWFSFAMAFISLCVEGTSVLPTFYALGTRLLWCLLTTLSGTICLLVLPLGKAKKSRFETYILTLIECNADLGKLRPAARKIFIAAGLLLLTTIFAVNIIAFLFAPWLSLGLFKPWNAWSGSRVFSLILVTFSYGSWLLPLPFFGITCLVLEQLFDDYYKRVSAKNTNSLDFVALKDEHRKLCDVVTLASKMFSPLILVLMALNIPLICFAFYITVNTPSLVIDGSSTLTFELVCVFSLVVSAATVAFILIFASRVNEKVSSG